MISDSEQIDQIKCILAIKFSKKYTFEIMPSKYEYGYYIAVNDSSNERFFTFITLPTELQSWQLALRYANNE